MIIAVAGTGGVGRTVLDAIDNAGRHEAIVLSRTAAINEPRRFAVDYSDVDKIKRVLKDNNVGMVVSALLLVDEDSTSSQNNLIRAAAQSGTVDRFIPSEYYIDFHAPIPGSDLFATFQLEAEAELTRHPQLTWTLIRAGLFLDHLTRPYNSKTTHITPFWAFVDIEYEQCVFPGNGAYPLVLTHSMDLAAYIELLAGLPAKQWPRESFVASNILEVRDLEPLIRNITGRDFQVTYDPVDAVYEGQITPLPSNEAVFSNPADGETFRQVEHQIMLSMFTKAHNLPGKNLGELFPEFQPTKVDDFFRAGWELKQSKASVDHSAL